MSDPYGRKLSDRYRIKQLVFFALLLAGTLLMLREAVHLNFSIRGTIGPGLYPAVVLAALALACVAAILRVVWRREILILSPFVEGLRNDTILRGLAKGTAAHADTGVRVVVRNGVGVFSALVAGLRGNATVTVISSETPDMTKAEIAAVALQRFQPVARLFYEPDALVVPAGKVVDLEQFFTAARETGRLRVAFARVHPAAEAVEHWLQHYGGAAVAGDYEQTAQALLDRLYNGACDAVVMPLHEAAEANAAGRVAILTAFAADAADCFGLAPTSQDLGYPLTVGEWGGVVLPRSASEEQCARFHDLFAKGFHAYTHGGERHDEDGTWSVTSTAAFRTFLGDVAADHGGGPVAIPPGKVVGFTVALLLVLIFPLLMELLGFPLAAFGFLGGIMALLEPRLNLWTGVRIIVLSAILAASLYFLFWNVFYVVFPEGLLWSHG